MFGSLGMPELLFILLLALLVFGPKRLPQVGRTLGRGLREFRRATNELKRTVETEISTAEMQPTKPTAASSTPPAEPASKTAPSPQPQPQPETDVEDAEAEVVPPAVDAADPATAEAVEPAGKE
jgi:TatA/E family protein of Tat protein translocase